MPSSDKYTHARELMVDSQLTNRGIVDERVLDAMRRVPRHLFVPKELRDEAYSDRPLPIGEGQTISQPYIVASMIEGARLAKGDIILDVGTGSGYQAAVLAQMGMEVYSVEIVEPLLLEAEARLKKLGYKNVSCRVGDGYTGWPEVAPFDAILIAAAANRVPQPLVEQLKLGGRLILPVKRGKFQDLLCVSKNLDGSIRENSLMGVIFVPMTGKNEDQG